MILKNDIFYSKYIMYEILIFSDIVNDVNLSKQGWKLYNEKRKQNKLAAEYNFSKLDRSDPHLIQVVRELGNEAVTDGSGVAVVRFSEQFRDMIKIVSNGRFEVINMDPVSTSVEAVIENNDIKNFSSKDKTDLLKQMQEILRDRMEKAYVPGEVESDEDFLTDSDEPLEDSEDEAITSINQSLDNMFQGINQLSALDEDDE